MATIVAPICPNTPGLLHPVDLRCASRFISASPPTSWEPLWSPLVLLLISQARHFLALLYASDSSRLVALPVECHPTFFKTATTSTAQLCAA